MPKTKTKTTKPTTKPTELHYFSFSSDVLIKSCPLPKEMIHSINAKTHTLTIEAAHRALSLSEYLKKTKKHMEYHDVEKMIHMIGKQLQRMEAMDKGIASFNLDDISVFYTHPRRVTSSTSRDSDSDSDSVSSHDETDTDTETAADTATVIHFALTNDDKVCDFDDAQQIKITTPYKPEYTSSSHKPGHNTAFISPEFKDFISKKTLPYSIHFKSGYYSFGLLCVYCFVSKTAVIAPVAPATNADAAAVDAVLAPIIHTKIYWFLKRVLDENPTARRYLCS
jgi:hypothetical protein